MKHDWHYRIIGLTCATMVVATWLSWISGGGTATEPDAPEHGSYIEVILHLPDGNDVTLPVYTDDVPDDMVCELFRTERVQKILMDMPLDALGWKFEYRSPPIDIRDVAPRVYDPNGLTDDVIRKLCSSGRVCEVMGHQWGWAVNVDRPYVFNHRMCRLCGQIAEDPRMAEDPRAERDKVPFPENRGDAMPLPYDGSWRLTEWRE